MQIQPTAQIWMLYECIGPRGRYMAPVRFFSSESTAVAWRDQVLCRTNGATYHIVPEWVWTVEGDPGPNSTAQADQRK